MGVKEGALSPNAVPSVVRVQVLQRDPSGLLITC